MSASSDRIAAATACGIPLEMAERLQGESRQALFADARQLHASLSSEGYALPEACGPEDLDGGPRRTPHAGPSMNDRLRAGIYAARRTPLPEDYL